MPTPMTFSRPTRFDCDGGGERGIDAAAQADEHAREAAFADVVASAEDESLVDSFVFVGEVGVEIALPVTVSTRTRSSENEVAEAMISPPAFMARLLPSKTSDHCRRPD